MDESRNELLTLMQASGVEIERMDAYQYSEWVPHSGPLVEGYRYRPVDQTEDWQMLGWAKQAGCDILWWSVDSAGKPDMSGIMGDRDWYFSHSLHFGIGGVSADKMMVAQAGGIGGKIQDAIELLNRHGYVVTRSPS